MLITHCVVPLYDEGADLAAMSVSSNFTTVVYLLHSLKHKCEALRDGLLAISELRPPRFHLSCISVRP